MIIKTLRNAIGLIIVFMSYIVPLKKVKRSSKQQQAVDKQTQNLELYQFFACPFCIKTRRAIRKLRLNIKTKEITKGSIYRQELLDSGGIIQAPCLKVMAGDEIKLIYNSADIIQYLNNNYNPK